jgi:preprotein translocase subunit SecY
MIEKFLLILKKINANKSLREKFLFTLFIFLVFRLFAHIPVPMINLAKLSVLFSQNQFLGLLNVLSGGTLSRFSIMAVGINPYISASIVIQLLTMVYPSLKEMQKDGETGKAKINQYTRFLSIPLAIFQSISILFLLNSQGLLLSTNILTLVAIVSSLVAGSMILMWLGELISAHGLGNGISMVLLAGIVSQFSVALGQLAAISQQDQWILLLTLFAMFLGLIYLIVFMNEAVRKIPMKYAKRTRGGRSFGGQTSFLPIKVNLAGVLPIIFAVSIMMVPSFLGKVLSSVDNEFWKNFGQNLIVWFDQTSPIYLTIYFLIVFLFTFFSAMIFFNTKDLSEELKKSGAFVPGIRPGANTQKYLDYVILRISFVGGLFLGSVAILPSLVQIMTNVGSLAIGGTSILIVVSVVLETSKQVSGMLVSQNYNKYY